MYEAHYSDDSFWTKVRKALLNAGERLMETALALYYCLNDSDTPAWAKAVIVSALGYFIWPLDAIPDALPGGYADDLGILLGAAAVVAAHVKELHWRQARRVLNGFFGKGPRPA